MKSHLLIILTILLMLTGQSFIQVVISNNDSDINEQNNKLVKRTYKPQQATKVLVVDWLADPWIELYRTVDTDLIQPNIQTGLYIHPFNDTREKNFWNTIDSDADIEIRRIAPTTTLLGWTDSSFINELSSYLPDVNVLADLNFELWDRFGLNQQERLALYNYIEQGHGLILTGGSLFDMRYKSNEDSEGLVIGAYGQDNRLFLDSSPTPDELRDYYRSSIAQMVGLGLIPIYEEIREWVGKILYQDSITRSLASLVWSVPLLPIGVPFSGDFVVNDTSDPLLQNINNNFSITLTHPTKDPNVGDHNTTMIGWQLEYPFYMASAAIDETKPYIDELRTYFSQSLHTVINHLVSNANEITDPPLPDIFPAYATYNATEEFMYELADNLTNTLNELLLNMYQARLNTPTQIEIPISFTIGSETVSHTLIVPIPVELQSLLKPATIIAISSDKLAAVLRYEVGSHRAVTFTFNPTLGGSTSQTLVKNAINWASNPPTPISTITIGNLNLSANLVTVSRNNVTSGNTLALTKNEVVNYGEEEVFEFQLNNSEGSIIIYWRDGISSISISKDGTEVESYSFQDGSHFAKVVNLHEAGTWNVKITTYQAGLLNPVAFELYQGDDTSGTTTTSSGTTATSSGTKTTSNGIPTSNLSLETIFLGVLVLSLNMIMIRRKKFKDMK